MTKRELLEKLENLLEEKGMCILNKIIPLSEQLRVIADKMEHYISVDNLSLPSYEKLFFNIDY